MSNTDNHPTTQQLEQLRDEARAAGDATMAEICERALQGDAEALVECERVIADALGMSY